MFVETRIEGQNKKHYLVHSYRKDNIVKKVRVYLGANLSEKEIEAKRKDAEITINNRVAALKKIRDPYETVLSKEELNELKTLVARGEIKIKHLDEEEWENFTKAFTYDTNAIEGSTATEGDVDNILKNNAKPVDLQKWEIQETHNVSAAVRYIRTAEEHISLKLIKKLHELCFTGTKSFAGKFREKGTEVVVVDRFGRVVHRGAPAEKVEKFLMNLINWYNKNKEVYPPIVLAAVVHNQFETVHPFADGNGRVGRLLLNNILLRHNKPPVNIEVENRGEYYFAIREYQHLQNIRPMLELIIKQYKKLKKTIG